MKKKVNYFNVTNNNGDYEIQNVYSLIDENGNYIHKNVFIDVFVTDKEIINYLNKISEYLKSKIPNE